MSTWCVYHLIHVRTPHQHIPKLIITDVPDDEEVTRDLLERAGYQFGEFGIAWANHVIAKLDVKTSPADLVARVRQALVRGDVYELTYEDLVARAFEPL